MNDDGLRTELLIRAARAVDHDLTASQYARDCDEGTVLPSAASKAAWDACGALRTAGEAFIKRAEQQAFAARRFRVAERRELATGIEYRGGDEAA